MDDGIAARQALARGERDLAAALFRSHLTRNADDAEALAFLAHEADRAEDWPLAMDLANRLIALHPRHAPPRVLAARAARQLGQNDAARRLARDALAIDPNYFPSMLELADIEQSLGNTQAAMGLWLRALELAEAHRSSGVPKRVAEALGRAAAAANQAMGQVVDHALAPFESAHGMSALQRIRGAGDIFAGRTERQVAHPDWQPGLMYIPGLTPRHWYEREAFSWVEQVEAATDMIREEMLAILPRQEGFAPYINDPPGKRGAKYWEKLNRSRDWSAFHFSRYGRSFEENRRRCPSTAALLDSLPLMRVPGYAPEPMFSMLKPQTRIPPHYGSVNGRLTVHLPLVVPPDCGALKVGDEARPWEEGRVMIFDDAMLHEAWNHSNDTRVVLIFDIWNPQLTEVECQAFSALLQAAQAFEQRHRQAS